MRRPAAVSALSRWLRDPGLLSAVGVLAAGVILVEVNVLSALDFRRWDFSESRRFTLSPQTIELLHGLSEPVQITVLLPGEDPLSVDVRHTLDAYQAETPQLSVERVDPDRDAAEFIALGARHPLLLGQDEAGRAQPGVALLLERSGRYHYIRRNELSLPDPSGNQELHIEGALSEGILRLAAGEKPTVCFTIGHGERSSLDVGPEGLAEFTHLLEQSNLATEQVSLDRTADLARCDLLVAAGPKQPFSAEEERRLQQRELAGADFLLLLDPIVDPRGSLITVGLSQLTASFGVRQLGGFVLELEPARRLPQGMGEVFLATPEPHLITASLETETHRSQQHYLASATQAFELAQAAVPLLTTSDRATSISDLRDMNFDPAAANLETQVIAAASHSSSLPASRLVVFGSSLVAENAGLRDAALFGNRAVLLAAVSWLSERPEALHIAAASPRVTSLPLTEESLAEVLRYVLIYMPLTSALAGLFVFLRRQSGERRAQDARTPKGASSS